MKKAKIVNKKSENQESKKNKIFLIIISSILIIGLLVGAFILGQKYANYEKKKIESSNIEEEKKEKPKYQVHIYQGLNGNFCMEKYEYCQKKYLSIPVKTKNARVEDFVLGKEPTFVLIFDGTYKIYDISKKTIIDTPITEHSSATIHTNRDYSEVYGIIYTDEDNSAYYNLTTKQEMYKNKYDNLSPKLGRYIEGTISKGEEDSSDSKTILLNINEEKEELSANGTCVYFDIYEFEEGNYFVESEGCYFITSSNLYNNNKKIIAENKAETEWSIDNDGNLYVLNKNNKVEKYNTNGDLLSTSKTYQKPLHIIKEYILYIENNNIYISDGKETIKLGKWENDFRYHSMISGYYEEYMFNIGSEKKSGIYLTFEYTGLETGENVYAPGIEYYFNPETKEVETFDLEYIGEYAKPVLYLYPEETTEVTINFEHEDNLTTTYPKFKDNWVVTAHPNGDLYDEKGNYYYGLYWEEDSNHKVDFKEGFYVSKENAISFLEEKLSIIGLNDKERNEFIMYWLPILEKNEHNLVYFELTEERESFNKIEISPKPDSLLRMAIHIKKINAPQNIKEQKLTPFKRKGFTAIEWGGVSYK